MSNDNIEEFNMFDPVWKENQMQNMCAQLFQYQDKLASESEIFNTILQFEMSDDRDTRYENTNSPKSLTRNAIILKGAVYKDLKEWETYLLESPYYSAAFE